MIKKIVFVLGIVSILLSIILFSCAKEGALSGGPRDTIPPKLLWSKPPMNGVNFHGKELVLRFDEFFDLKNINQNFFSSPPFENQPKFKLTGKKLIIKLKDSLRDSATYILDFGEAIVDFHEGNVLKNFRFIFSTYDKIDSLQLQGQVVDAYSLEPKEGVYVMLYKNTDDSVVFKYPPRYISKTDKQGNFVIGGIKKGRYKVFALNDLNNDYIYDGIENEVAFSDTLISPWQKVIKTYDTIKAGTVIQHGKETDTLKHDSIVVKKEIKYFPTITLYMFQENNRPQQIVEANRPYSFWIRLRFSQPLKKNYYKVKSLSGQGKYKVQYFRNTDSMYIWLLDSTLQKLDTVRFSIQFLAYTSKKSKIITDTLEVHFPKDTLYTTILKPENNQINFFDSLVLASNIYMRGLYKSKLEMVQVIDTNVYNDLMVKPVCLRVEPDVIDVLFNRKFDLNTLFISLPDYPGAKLKYSYDEKNKILSVHLPKTVAQDDTVNFSLFYRVQRFTDYYEPHGCKTALTLVRQKIVNTEWIYKNRLVLTFKKPVKDLKIKNLNYDSVKIERQKVIIYLNNPSKKLSFDIKTLDFKDLSVQPNYFEKHVTVNYEWKPNKIQKFSRPQRNIVKIKYLRPIDTVIRVRIKSWATKDFTYDVHKDTLIVKLLNKKLKQVKFLNFKITIGSWNWDKLEKQTDTLQVEYGQDQFLKKTFYYTPVNFTVKRVPDNYEKFYLKAAYRPGAKYRILVFPGAYQDIMNKTNDTLFLIDFSTTPTKDYGSLSLVIPKGKWYRKTNLILQITDDKGNVIKQKQVSKPGKIKFNQLPEGQYQLRIIYDRNKNGRWDTGNYMRKEQPEKVVIWKNKLKVKPNWEIEEKIKIE